MTPFKFLLFSLLFISNDNNVYSSEDKRNSVVSSNLNSKHKNCPLEVVPSPENNKKSSTREYNSCPELISEKNNRMFDSSPQVFSPKDRKSHTLKNVRTSRKNAGVQITSFSDPTSSSENRKMEAYEKPASNGKNIPKRRSSEEEHLGGENSGDASLNYSGKKFSNDGKNNSATRNRSKSPKENQSARKHSESVDGNKPPSSVDNEGISRENKNPTKTRESKSIVPKEEKLRSVKDADPGMKISAHPGGESSLKISKIITPISTASNESSVGKIKLLPSENSVKPKPAQKAVPPSTRTINRSRSRTSLFDLYAKRSPILTPKSMPSTPVAMSPRISSITSHNVFPGIQDHQFKEKILEKDHPRRKKKDHKARKIHPIDKRVKINADDLIGKEVSDEKSLSNPGEAFYLFASWVEKWRHQRDYNLREIFSPYSRRMLQLDPTKCCLEVAEFIFDGAFSVVGTVSDVEDYIPIYTSVDKDGWIKPHIILKTFGVNCYVWDNHGPDPRTLGKVERKSKTEAVRDLEVTLIPGPKENSFFSLVYNLNLQLEIYSYHVMK